MFQTLIAENDGVLDGPGSHSPEALVAASCFQQLLNALLSIFSWFVLLIVHRWYNMLSFYSSG